MSEANFKYVVSGDILQKYIDGLYKPRTVWERVFLLLKSKGIDVYSPGQHKGQCTSLYVVVKNSGTIPSLGATQSGSQTIDVILYCPLTNYTSLEPYTIKIQQLLHELREFIRPTGNIIGVLVDDNVDAYTNTIEYQTFQKLRR